MVRQSGIEDLLHFRVFRQKFCDPAAILVMLLHAHRKCLHTTQHQPAFKWSKNAACGLLHKPKPLFMLRPGTNQYSAQPVAVPIRNFVVECITISAPSSIGRCKYGDINVLSTLISIPCSWQMSATARMSVSVISGLVGVSI